VIIFLHSLVLNCFYLFQDGEDKNNEKSDCVDRMENINYYSGS
jgi:hypothetical protein